MWGLGAKTKPDRQRRISHLMPIITNPDKGISPKNSAYVFSIPKLEAFNGVGGLGLRGHCS